jgi:hypothetical protein
MTFFAITRHGLATIAVLVMVLWSIVLATAARQHQTALEARRLHLQWGDQRNRRDLLPASQPGTNSGQRYQLRWRADGRVNNS